MRVVSARTVDEYFAAVPPGPRAALERLRKAIRSAAPDATEVISYGMPSFRTSQQVAYYAAFTDHLSLFVPWVLDDLKADVAPYRAGKGTLQFTFERPIPLALVKKLVRARLAQLEEKAAKPARAKAPAPRKGSKKAATRARAKRREA